MFSKLNHRISGNYSTKFYEIQATPEDVHSGYLYKSPPPSVLSKSLKSWKRRYFVLSKVGESLCELRYFRDEKKREKLGEVDVYQISLLFISPEAHPTWEWIQKNFKCSSSCVLYMRVADRDYFLVGENSEEANGWFSAIFKVLRTPPQTLISPEENRKIRSISEPERLTAPDDDQDGAKYKEKSEDDLRLPSISVRNSAPESYNTLYNHYDYPRNYRMSTSLESQQSEDDEESETEEDGSCYMDMGRVREELQKSNTEDNESLQPRADGNKSTGNTFLSNCISSSTGQNRQIPQESKTLTCVQKDICVTQEDLRKSMIFSEEAGKPCVSDWKQIQSSGLFHEGDQILAINDLRTDNLEDVQTYLDRLNKNHVKLTILRQPGSRPLSGCSA